MGRSAPGVQGYRGVCRTRRGAGGYVLTLPSVLLLLRTGVGLPPYRGWPARPGPGFSGKAGRKAPGASAPGPQGTRGVPADRRLARAM